MSNENYCLLYKKKQESFVISVNEKLYDKMITNK